mmetsp:Transcript_17180/g.21407  ORF Transcript_17180/g.21407 Transcript_17180/m.21407 type:complete len:905 (-) Transcript_17180:437-3151(-)
MILIKQQSGLTIIPILFFLVLAVIISITSVSGNHDINCPNDVITQWASVNPKHVTIECIGVVKNGREKIYLRINATGIPNHDYKASLESRPYSYLLPLLDYSKPLFPSRDTSSSLKNGNIKNIYDINTLGGKNAIVGVALNGIPFLSPLKATNLEAVRGHNPDDHDDCLGYISTEGQYGYRTAPPCLFSNEENVENSDSGKQGAYDAFTFAYSFLNVMIEGDDDDSGPFMIKIKGAKTGGNVSTAPFVVGYAMDGYHIYSPYDENGIEHSALDTCGGKYYNGNYAYFATTRFPYLLGCFGPALPPSHAAPTKEDGNDSHNATYLTCPPGRYAPSIYSLSCKRCAAGRYGALGTRCSAIRCVGDTNDRCTGTCAAGYFCPAGSSSSRAEACGGVGFYCPAGATDRVRVREGWYSVPLANEDDFGNDVDKNDKQQQSQLRREGEKICPLGFWCKGGIRFACSESGSFGNLEGLTSPLCMGRCPLAHYCTPFSPVPIQCPAGRYGAEESLTSPLCSGLCDEGYYCEAGSVSPQQRPCPAGLAGIEKGSKDERCSNKCDPLGVQCIPHECEEGYYCPSNSTSVRMIACGGAAAYCPKGSSTPSSVSDGYYTVGSMSLPGYYQSSQDEFTRTSQVKCEPGTYCITGVRYACPTGTYGSEHGLTSVTCSGDCSPGFYCPVESVRADQMRCGGAHFFCPRGSSLPLLVPTGSYSYGGPVDTRPNAALCPPGSYCVKGVAHPCPAGSYGSSTGLTSPTCDGPSQAGFYTPAGSTSARQIACPPGRYGLPGMTNENCTGSAAPGYYTPAASSSPRQMECGGEMVYCPAGAARPFNVSVGYYSVGGTSTTRTSQRRCRAWQRTRPEGVTVSTKCPSTTRWQGTVVVAPPQQVDVDYDIDPEDQFRYDFQYPENI